MLKTKGYRHASTDTTHNTRKNPHKLPKYHRITRHYHQQQTSSFLTNTPHATATVVKSARNLTKLSKLRQLMTDNNLDAYIIPHADPHLSEYVTAHDNRRQFISEFSGSAGTAVVTKDSAFLWTDGRYYLQAAQELPSHFTLMKDGLPDTPSIPKFLSTLLPYGSKLGIDPAMHSISQVKNFTKILKDSGVDLVDLQTNLVDSVWYDQPGLPPGKIRTFEFAGEDSAAKITRVCEEMVKNKACCMVLSALDDIAWLFNLRGEDVDFNPVFLSYSVIMGNNVHFFVDQDKFSNLTKDGKSIADFLPAEVILHPYNLIIPFISENVAKYVNEQSAKSKVDPTIPHKVWVDTANTNYAIYKALSIGNDDALVPTTNAVNTFKSIKNEVEIAASKHAHLKDAVAVIQFLSWFESQYNTLPEADNRDTSQYNEYDVATILESFRRKQEGYIGPSFDTISSIGPNGAIIHYKPDETYSSKVYGGEVYLLDSGGQYVDGTTDITRTFYIPSKFKPVPTDYHKDMNTRVLQGHIDVVTAKFPSNTPGSLIDSFARHPLWSVGKNYPHGTGHGVSSGIAVHEGPIGITPKNSVPLKPGNILSNEPGFYEDGSFGVRIENLVYVTEKKLKYEGPVKFYGFENLTMVPIDRSLIDISLLTPTQVNYLNDYHQQVFNAIMPLLQQGHKVNGVDNTIAMDWLAKNTVPL